MRIATIVMAFLPLGGLAVAQNKPLDGSKDAQTVRAEHSMIGLGGEKAADPSSHPDAQWYPDAASGLFLHWDISSVRAMNISWPMIPGRPLAAKRIDDPAERERIIREGDWNLDGKPPAITPNEYWEQAKRFNPQNYDPDKWMKAAKEAGFTYVVLTAKHHGGFALWPSKYGNFNTTNYMGGRDLIKEYVEACRRHDLKVGLYFSPPDWYFDREHMSFLYHGARRRNPEFPNLGPDLKPRELKFTKDQIAAHQKAYAEMVKGQVEELLTNYGKIDLMWFDGKPAIEGGENVITRQRVRELQPGIVMNPRLHGKGDFITYERTLKTDKVHNGWAEFCNTWASNWSYVDQPMRSNGFILGQLARSRSLGINYLLGIGPMSNGDFSPKAYENMAMVAEWMKRNGESIRGTKPLPPSESASKDVPRGEVGVPAVAKRGVRYLFAIPQFKDNRMGEDDMLPFADETLTIKTALKPATVTLLGDGSELTFSQDGQTIRVQLPAAKRTKLVDVVRIELERN